MISPTEPTPNAALTKEGKNIFIGFWLKMLMRDYRLATPSPAAQDGTAKELEVDLREADGDDHERGCEGRNYSCTCGYDKRTRKLLSRSADALATATLFSAAQDDQPRYFVASMGDKGALHTTAAQALEVEGYRAFNAGIGVERLVESPGFDDSNPRALTDHATATRQIAELRAERERIIDDRAAWTRRALAAEADAAKVREAATWAVDKIMYLYDGCEEHDDLRQALTQTQRGA